MWVMCDCFKYFIFIKGSILHCFHDVFVSGPAQMDLYILTDGALPLPAHSPPRIVANVKLVLFFFFFFAYFCLGILSIGKVLHSVEVERECETTALYLVEQLH